MVTVVSLVTPDTLAPGMQTLPPGTQGTPWTPDAAVPAWPQPMLGPLEIWVSWGSWGPLPLSPACWVQTEPGL